MCHVFGLLEVALSSARDRLVARGAAAHSGMTAAHNGPTRRSSGDYRRDCIAH